MPTPNGVNYLLQFLMISSNSPIIRLQESKVDVQSYVKIFVLCFHMQLCFHYQYILKPHKAESVANIMIIFVNRKRKNKKTKNN